MQKLKDILTTAIIILIIGMVAALGFAFLLMLIPIIIIGTVWCYVKDERNC